MGRAAAPAHLRARAELVLRERRRARRADIRPQPGPQTQFAASTADIAIYGGAAGGGKSWAVLLEAAKHRDNPRFAAVVFRREMPQITNPGGLWDESMGLFPRLEPGAEPRQKPLGWRFPSGAVVRFSHLQLEHDVLSWQGAQVALIAFDELTHFSRFQFFYMLSRGRSTSGVRPYFRATCNPDSDSWVADFIGWWIDQETGFPIPERAGVLRWMARDGEALLWGNRPIDVYVQKPSLFDPQLKTGAKLEDLLKSVTFIPSSLSDNPALTSKDPSYLGNLLALPLVERERLLGGNWKVRRQGGKVFKREWFDVVREAPAGARAVRFWDLAATVPKQGNKDPDWTVGVLLSELDGIHYVEDVKRIRGRPLDVERLIKQTALEDGVDVPVWIEQEPGSSGVNTIDHYQREVLNGFEVRGLRATGDKAKRADPVSSAAEARNVKLVQGPWNKEFLDEHEAFPQAGVHDDQVDGTSGAWRALHEPDTGDVGFV